MSQIGTLAASASTTITQNWVPEFVIIESVDLANPISNLTVTVGGVVRQALTAQERITAANKYLMQGLLGVDVAIGSVLKLGNGFIANQTLQLTMTNAVASAYTVYGYSTGRGDLLISLAETTIQASSYEVFEDFQSLIFNPTNINYADITFMDHTEQMTVNELAALFSSLNTTDADGKLGTQIVIDNRFGNIISAKLYTTSGGANTVAVYRS